MANPFAITVPSNTLLLNEKRQAQVAFSVTNLSGRPLRGRALLKSDKAEANAWLTVDDEAERDFAIAETKQYVVRIAVPNDAPAGFAPFRLDMVGVDNPDENFTQGPTVTFQVPAPLPKSPPFPWWIILVALALLIVIGVVIFLLTRGGGEPSTPTAVSTAPPISTPTTAPPSNVAVPSLIDLSLKDAQDRLAKVGLRVGQVTKKGTLTKKSEIVLDQNPRAGIVVGPNTGIDLTVEATVLFQRNEIRLMDSQRIDLDSGVVGAGNFDLALETKCCTGFPTLITSRFITLSQGGASVQPATDRLAACRDVLRSAQPLFDLEIFRSNPRLCVLTSNKHIAEVNIVPAVAITVPPGPGFVLLNVVVWGD